MTPTEADRLFYTTLGQMLMERIALLLALMGGRR